MEYAQKNRYNASQVPAEWHGWLHYITDHTGDEVSLDTFFLMHTSPFPDSHITCHAAATAETKEVRD